MVQANQFLVALDDGHGVSTPGKQTPFVTELGRTIHENEFNKAVVALLDIELKRCGFKTLLTAPTDADTSLTERTNLANSKGADIFVSIHYNALGNTWGTAEGHSIYVMTPASANPNSVRLAEAIAKYLKEGTPQVWRGVLAENFHVLRETTMPAVLSENGFMDNHKEALYMIDPKFQLEVAQEHAKGICDYFGVSYIHASQSNPDGEKGIGIAKVKVESLSLRDAPTLNGKLIRTLKKGESYFVYAIKDGWYNLGANQWASNVDGKYMDFVPNAELGKAYRVSTGTFKNKAQADAAAAKINKEFGYVVYVNEA
jgi:N-acetylmuramoyl-L-alanine amidase